MHVYSPFIWHGCFVYLVHISYDSCLVYYNFENEHNPNNRKSVRASEKAPRNRNIPGNSAYDFERIPPTPITLADKRSACRSIIRAHKITAQIFYSILLFIIMNFISNNMHMNV